MKHFLAIVFAFFIAFLIAVYVGSKHAAPVVLDERGQPVKGA